MNLKSYIDQAGGVAVVANMINITNRAVYKWLSKDELPRTEYTGETKYAEIIEEKTDKKVLKEDLLKAGKPKGAAHS